MKNANFCHYCGHHLGGSGLYTGGSGGSLKSIGNALKTGDVGKLFSKSVTLSSRLGILIVLYNIIFSLKYA
jgi:hypothetical protein